MALAIFDLDETLIAADSVSLFAEFLVEQELVDSDFIRQDAAYMDQYHAGNLDIGEYIAFYSGALGHCTVEQIQQLMPRFVEHYIEPVIYPKALSLLNQHRAQGDTLIIISATAEFIVKPIAERFKVEHVLSIELEATPNDKGELCYNGKIKGFPSFREGKIARLNEWMAEHKATLDGAWFYSDSINDLPLLKIVENPVATNPDSQLEQIAREQNWPILRFEPPRPATPALHPRPVILCPQ